MKKKESIILIAIISLGICGCDTIKKEYKFLNADFEYGSLRGWENILGTAFTDNTIDISGGGNVDWNVVGNFFYNGELADLGSTGSMQSEVFNLKGNGKIGLMIGGGKNFSQCYISLCDAKSNQELVSIANYKFDFDNPNSRMHRVILNGSNYIGKDVYLKVVDNDANTDGYNFLILDDFVINFQGEEDEVGMTHDATRYIEAHKDEVKNTIYRHNYHLMPPVGWMNDPNGFSIYNGKINLFYQHSPYTVGWSTMYWGHATSDDFIKWEDQPVALAPDKAYDKDGCFSGSVIVENNKMYALYTAVSSAGQQQAIAFSNDGINFEKLNRNPVIKSSLLPDNAITADFRDPKLFKVNNTYYAILGSKLKTPGGQLLLYKSNSLIEGWGYVGVILSSSITQGGLFECPDYEKIDNQDVIISSPQYVRSSIINEYQNEHSVTYQIGSFNLDTAKFENVNGEMSMEEFDKGFDFYAAQCLQTNDDRVVMVAWMNMWNRSTFPSAAYGWTGAMTLPRELNIIDNHIYQTPVREIQKYRRNEYKLSSKTVEGMNYINKLNGRCSEIEFEIDTSKLNNDGTAGIRLFAGEENHTDIYYDKESNQIVFDRRENGQVINGGGESGANGVRYCPVNSSNGKVKLHIFLDKSSVEVFINDGYYTMTGTVFPNETDDKVALFTTSGQALFENIKKYDLVIK